MWIVYKIAPRTEGMTGSQVGCLFAFHEVKQTVHEVPDCTAMSTADFWVINYSKTKNRSYEKENLYSSSR